VKTDVQKIKNSFLSIGIGQKIYASMAVLALITLIMAGATLTMISSISESTQILAQDSLPQLVQGGKLSEKNGELTSKVRALIKAQSPKEVENLQLEAGNVLTDIATLVKDMQVADEDRSKLSEQLQKIEEVIPKLASNTIKRLSYLEETHKKLTQAQALHIDLVKEASPLYDDAEFGLMISLSDLKDVGNVIKVDEAKKIKNTVMIDDDNAGGNTNVESLPSVNMETMSTEIDQNIATLQNSLKFIAELNLLAGYYSTAEHLAVKEAMVPLKEVYTSVAAKIMSIKASIESDSIKEKTEQFVGYGEGTESIFALREKYLVDSIEAENLSNQLNEALGQLQSSLQKQSLQIEDDASVKGEQAVASSNKIKSTTLLMTCLLIVVALATGFLYVRPAIVNRLIDVYHATEEIASGNLETEIKTSGNDELAKMADALVQFRDNEKARIKLEEEQKQAELKQAEDRKKAMMALADQFEEQVGQIVKTVARASQEMQKMTGHLSETIQNTSTRSDTVLAAAEQASQNVQAVAAATEQMSMSIREISGNVLNTADTAKDCTSFAHESQGKLDELREAVEEIDAVIQSINDVAEQTNLLALNATIEAARAGDAGKGFAVVASEVKALAGQTHVMTDEISGKVEHIKNSASGTISSVNDILSKITLVDEKTTSVASAVEEQSTATAEISSNIQEAATGTDKVSSNMQDIQQAANDSANSTELLKTASNELTAQTDKLQTSVKEFLAEIRSS
jgi:methyl-accepting chemotaxis protein